MAVTSSWSGLTRTSEPHEPITTDCWALGKVTATGCRESMQNVVSVYP